MTLKTYMAIRLIVTVVLFGIVSSYFSANGAEGAVAYIAGCSGAWIIRLLMWDVYRIYFCKGKEAN